MQAQALAIEMAVLTKQFGRYPADDRLNLAVHSGSVFGFLDHRRGCPGRLYSITRTMQGAFHEVFSNDGLRRPGVCDA
jgi:hypothetical protein